jgi:hypothetical protein
MKSLNRRLNRLEDRLAPVARQQIVVSLYDAGQTLALDGRTCIQILRDAGHIDPASATCLLDFTHIPRGLDAAELEKHLREHGTDRSPQ